MAIFAQFWPWLVITCYNWYFDVITGQKFPQFSGESFAGAAFGLRATALREGSAGPAARVPRRRDGQWTVDSGNRGRSEPKKVGDVEFLGEKCLVLLVVFWYV